MVVLTSLRPLRSLLETPRLDTRFEHLRETRRGAQAMHATVLGAPLHSALVGRRGEMSVQTQEIVSDLAVRVSVGSGVVRFDTSMLASSPRSPRIDCKLTARNTVPGIPNLFECRAPPLPAPSSTKSVSLSYCASAHGILASSTSGTGAANDLQWIRDAISGTSCRLSSICRVGAPIVQTLNW